MNKPSDKAMQLATELVKPVYHPCTIYTDEKKATEEAARAIDAAIADAVREIAETLKKPALYQERVEKALGICAKYGEKGHA